MNDNLMEQYLNELSRNTTQTYYNVGDELIYNGSDDKFIDINDDDFTVLTDDIFIVINNKNSNITLKTEDGIVFNFDDNAEYFDDITQLFKKR